MHYHLHISPMAVDELRRAVYAPSANGEVSDTPYFNLMAEMGAELEQTKSRLRRERERSKRLEKELGVITLELGVSDELREEARSRATIEFQNATSLMVTKSISSSNWHRSQLQRVWGEVEQLRAQLRELQELEVVPVRQLREIEEEMQKYKSRCAEYEKEKYIQEQLLGDAADPLELEARVREQDRELIHLRTRHGELEALCTPRPDWRSCIDARQQVGQNLSPAVHLSQTSQANLLGLTRIVSKLVSEVNELREALPNSSPWHVGKIGEGVPTWLQYSGVLPNVMLDRKQVYHLVRETWKERNQLVCNGSSSGKDLGEHLATVAARYCPRNPMELIYNIVDGCKRFGSDAELRVFLKILLGQVDVAQLESAHELVEALRECIIARDERLNGGLRAGTLTLFDYRSVLCSSYPALTHRQLAHLLLLIGQGDSSAEDVKRGEQQQDQLSASTESSPSAWIVDEPTEASIVALAATLAREEEKMARGLPSFSMGEAPGWDEIAVKNGLPILIPYAHLFHEGVHFGDGRSPFCTLLRQIHAEEPESFTFTVLSLLQGPTSSTSVLVSPSTFGIALQAVDPSRSEHEIHKLVESVFRSETAIIRTNRRRSTLSMAPKSSETTRQNFFKDTSDMPIDSLAGGLAQICPRFVGRPANLSTAKRTFREKMKEQAVIRRASRLSRLSDIVTHAMRSEHGSQAAERLRASQKSTNEETMTRNFARALQRRTESPHCE